MDHSSQNMEMSINDESLLVSDLNVIEDEYVFIQDEDMEFDDESYDHCDLTPDLSCAASVCSGLTLNDLILQEGIGSSMVSLEEERNDESTKHESSIALSSKKDEDVVMDVFSSQNGRRLCNKKRRKKLKMLKKAAAAAHFEACRKAQLETVTNPPSNESERSTETERSTSRSPKPSRPKTKKSVHNLAVACATESLASYREEVGGKQKKSSIVNYVL